MPKNFNELLTPEFLAKIKLAADLAMEQDSVAAAKKLIWAINDIFSSYPDLKKEDLDIFKELNSSLIKAKFVSLASVPEKEIIDLVKNHIQIILDEPIYDFNDKLKHKLLVIYDLPARDSLKLKIQQAFLANNNKISKEKIKIGDSWQEPNIKNWLKDYIAKNGSDKVSSLKVNQYLANSENTKNLSDEKRKRLKKVVVCFERTKYSSAEPDGLEERFVAILPDGKMKIMNQGVLEDVDSSIVRIMKEVLPDYSELAVSSEPEKKSSKTDSRDVLADEEEVDPLVERAKKDESQIEGEEGAQEEIEDESPEISQENSLESLEEKTKEESPQEEYSLPELEKILQDYPLSGLEHKAIKQEIARLRRQNKK